MALKTPWALDGPSTDAQIARGAMGSLVGSAGGLVATGGLEVTQKGTPTMAILIKGGTAAEGAAWVPGTFTTSQSPFFIWNDASAELAIPASDATNPRIETIVVRVYDNATDSSGKTEAVFEAVKGTATPGATLENLSGIAALPKSALLLAYCLVPAKATSIVTADIKNMATLFVSFPEAVINASTYPSSTVRLSAVASASAEWIPSTTRPAFVIVKVEQEELNKPLLASLTVGGEAAGQVQITGSAANPPKGVLTAIVPAGKKIKVSVTGGGVNNASSTELLL